MELKGENIEIKIKDNNVLQWPEVSWESDTVNKVLVIHVVHCETDQRFIFVAFHHSLSEIVSGIINLNPQKATTQASIFTPKMASNSKYM